MLYDEDDRTVDYFVKFIERERTKAATESSDEGESSASAKSDL